MHSIYIKDADLPGLGYDESYLYLHEAGEWAKNNCQTFISYDVVDVSDVSSAGSDWMAQYAFNGEKDLMWFKLKWVK